MPVRVVRLAVTAAERLVDQDGAVANARSSATRLAQARVDRLEVESFLEEHRRRRGPSERSSGHTPVPGVRRG